MKLFAQTYYLLQFIICLICLSISCGEGGNDNYSETNDERNKEPEITVSPVTNLEAKSTQIANQLLITWQNPNTPNLLGVELSYLQKDGGTHNGKQIIQGTAGKTLPAACRKATAVQSVRQPAPTGGRGASGHSH